MVEEILRALNLKFKLTSSGNYVASCPFGSRHSDGFDRHPSFSAVDLNDNDFLFNCFACGVKGNSRIFARLSKEYGFYHLVQPVLDRILNPSPKERVKSLQSFTSIYAQRILGKPLRSNVNRSHNFDEIVPSPDLNDEIKERLLRYTPYLAKRGIDRAIAKDFKIGYDERDNSILIPIFTEDLKLVAFSKRFIRGTKKYKHSSSFRYSNIFYGEHLLNRDIILSSFFQLEAENYKDSLSFVSSRIENGLVNLSYKYLFIVEGFFDVMKIYSFSYPAIAIMGSSNLTGRRLHLLLNYFVLYSKVCSLKGTQPDNYIVILGDGDSAGKHYVDEMYKVLQKEFLRVIKLICPSGLDPGDFGTREEFIAFLDKNGVFDENTVEVQKN